MVNKTPALICIDIQKGFQDSFWGRRNNPDAEIRMEELLLYWREQEWPIFHLQHLSRLPDSPLRPNQIGCEFMDFAKPCGKEPTFVKHVNSGFIGTSLENSLRAMNVHDVVLMGFTTDHCVSTTTRMAANFGFNVHLSVDALCCFDRMDFEENTLQAELIHKTALASLHNEFATVCSQENLIREFK